MIIFTLHDSRPKPCEVWRQTQLVGMKTWADKHDVSLPGLGSWAPESVRAEPKPDVNIIDGDELLNEVESLLNHFIQKMVPSLDKLKKLRTPKDGKDKKPATPLEEAFRDSGFYFGATGVLVGVVSYLTGEASSIDFIEVSPADEEDDE